MRSISTFVYPSARSDARVLSVTLAHVLTIVEVAFVKQPHHDGDTGWLMEGLQSKRRANDLPLRPSITSAYDLSDDPP